MASRRTGSRLKYTAILLAVLASGLALTASTQTWFTLHLTTASGHSGALAVAGSSAAPAIAALSLAGVAFGGALALAGRILRYVLALLGLVLAASIIGSAVTAIADPAGSGISVVTKATGIAGDSGVRAVIASASSTAWPAVALASGILLALAALLVAVTAHLWPSTSRRYGATADASEHPRRSATADEQNLSAADRKARAREAAIDDWDDLSRGDDPTEAEDIDDDAQPESSDGAAHGDEPPVR
jgi:uncharacterized membrane protein (TIGR02234 family)